jgi:transcriptional regulator with XRE-family HTH domain
MLPSVVTRANPVHEASRRAGRQLREVLDDLRNARRAAGLSQRATATAVGCSRQEIGVIERGKLADVGVIQLARFGAVVGLDVPIRTFPGGSPLRDASQLRLLTRFIRSAGRLWHVDTELPVSRDPRERRAFDALLSRGSARVGTEAITRLTDVQAQVRAVTLKQEAGGVSPVILVLADTRHNRWALRAASATLDPAFPLSPRIVFAALRAGQRPPANGRVVV